MLQRAGRVVQKRKTSIIQNTLPKSLVGNPLGSSTSLLSSAHANKLMHNDSLSYSPTRRQPLSQNNVPREGTYGQTQGPSKAKRSVYFLFSPHLFLWPILSTQLKAVKKATLGPALSILVPFPLSTATLFRTPTLLKLGVFLRSVCKR